MRDVDLGESESSLTVPPDRLAGLMQRSVLYRQCLKPREPFDDGLVKQLLSNLAFSLLIDLLRGATKATHVIWCV
jgi:hypothetical protein